MATTQRLEHEEAEGQRPSVMGVRRPVVVGLAVVAAAGVWLIFALLGVDLRSPAGGGSPSHDIGVGQVVFSSTAAALAGWALLAALERLTRRARSVWRATATVVLLLSLAGPMSGTGVSVANRLGLVVFHLTVAAILIALLPRTGGAQRPTKIGVRA